jgi:hypothetical protein
MFKAPAIYFPSTVVFLDDDHMYAKLLIKRLGYPQLRHFESPEFLLKQSDDDFLFVNRNVYINQEPHDFAYIKKNLENLKKTGDLISVLVSDLHMDGISGIDIFSKIKSIYLGRILVSIFMEPEKNPGITDAQNSGDVDMVLDKTESFEEKLPRAIMAAKNKFFTGLSNCLFTDAVEAHPLSDTEFAKFYISKIFELKPKEIRPNGNFTRFTFVGSNDNPSYTLTITDKKEIQNNLNSSAAETVPKELIPHLASGKYILCHNDPDDVLPEGGLWPLFIRPAQQFISKHAQFFYHFSEAQYDITQTFYSTESKEHRI